MLPANYLERLPSDLRVDVSHCLPFQCTLVFSRIKFISFLAALKFWWHSVASQQSIPSTYNAVSSFVHEAIHE